METLSNILTVVFIPVTIFFFTIGIPIMIFFLVKYLINFNATIQYKMKKDYEEFLEYKKNIQKTKKEDE